MKRLPAAVFLILLCACETTDFNTAPEHVMAYVPVYARANSFKQIELQPSRPTENPGKIYVRGNYIFQNEQYKGIHIIDNSDRSDPIKTAFLEIPFNTEMAIRGNYLYVNSINDMLVIDMSNAAEPKVVNILKDAFPLVEQLYPPASGLFVCPDPAKGVVVDWKMEQVEKAECRR